MKRLRNGFVMSMSMFSIIPAPMIWDETAMPLVVDFFPFVGLIIGVVWYGMAALLNLCNVPPQLWAAACQLLPLAISGFIHIDGFMDVCDAAFSRAEPAKKHAILKDPHVGAFAVSGICAYMLLGCAALAAAYDKNVDLRAFMLISVLSRSLAGVILFFGKPMSETGFAASFRKGAKTAHKTVPLITGVLCVMISLIFGVAIPMLALLISGVLAGLWAIKQLDGVNGDVCGFILVFSELCALIALAVI